MIDTQTTSAHESGFSLLTDGYYILPEDAAIQPIRQEIEFEVSSPKPWTPAKDQIGTLEKTLEIYLAERSAGDLPMPEETAYKRQYFGVEHDGKPMIYGNFYPADQGGGKESTQFVVVEDGGRYYWAILYDPQENKIIDIAFHGEA